MLSVTAPAASQDLTDLTTVKTELQISGTDHDTFLTSLITEASRAIMAACGQTLGAETVQQTERNVCAPLLLARGPADTVSITSVVEDGTTLAATDYELDGFRLYRLSSDKRVAWSADKVVVTYTRGYSLPASVPVEVERVAIEMIKASYYARARDPGIRSENVQDVYSASYVDAIRSGRVPPDLLPALRNVSIGVGSFMP
jgi:hypothetical protein